MRELGLFCESTDCVVSSHESFGGKYLISSGGAGCSWRFAPIVRHVFDSMIHFAVGVAAHLVRAGTGAISLKRSFAKDLHRTSELFEEVTAGKTVLLKK